MMRIMIFGTFDMIHQGHEDFFRQARALANDPYLIVSIARDSATARIKGVSPRNTEDSRLATVRKHTLVDEAVLGDEKGFMPHILQMRPDIIALGYDQAGEYVDRLDTELQTRGLSIRIVRLLPYKEHIFKTSKLTS